MIFTNLTYLKKIKENVNLIKFPAVFIYNVDRTVFFFRHGHAETKPGHEELCARTLQGKQAGRS